MNTLPDAKITSITELFFLIKVTPEKSLLSSIVAL